MDQKGLVELLDSKRSAGVAPNVNRRNPLHVGNDTGKWGIELGFGTQGRNHQKSQTGVSVAPQKGIMSSQIFKKHIFLDCMIQHN